MVAAEVPYTFKKREIYYFVRYIPSDLSDRYSSARISYSLRTKSPRLAIKRSLIASAQLDEYWDKGHDRERKCASNKTQRLHNINIYSVRPDCLP